MPFSLFCHPAKNTPCPRRQEACAGLAFSPPCSSICKILHGPTNINIASKTTHLNCLRNLSTNQWLQRIPVAQGIPPSRHGLFVVGRRSEDFTYKNRLSAFATLDSLLRIYAKAVTAVQKTFDLPLFLHRVLPIRCHNSLNVFPPCCDERLSEDHFSRHTESES